jgi:hypothetical protein
MRCRVHGSLAITTAHIEPYTRWFSEMAITMRDADESVPVSDLIHWLRHHDDLQLNVPDEREDGPPARAWRHAESCPGAGVRGAGGHGLTISKRRAHRLTRQGIVVVAFKLTDSGYRPRNTSRSLLASVSGASDVASQDALPAYLAPGDSPYAAAAFDITQNT